MTKKGNIIMEKSILNSHYPSATQVVDIGGREVSKYYTNVEDEYYALRKGIGLLDCSTFGVYRISGDDASSFLDKLATKDISYLNTRNVSECCFLNEKAIIIGSAYILRTDDDFLVITPWESAKNLYDWLIKNKVSDVEIEDLLGKKALVFVEGLYSWKFLKEFFSYNIENIALRTFAQDITYEGENILVARIGRSGEYGYMIMVDEYNAGLLFNQLLEKGTEYDVRLCGIEALEICMLETRQPIMRFENEQVGNLFELDQQWMIQYDKEEDFIGKEEMLRLFSSERRFLPMGFECKSTGTIEDGTDIHVKDQRIGKILYTKYNYQNETIIGLALLDCAFAASGLSLKINVNGSPQEITTFSNPYVRPTSWWKIIML